MIFLRNKKALLENKRATLENRREFLGIEGHFWELKRHIDLRTSALAILPPAPSPFWSDHFLIFQAKVQKLIFLGAPFFHGPDILTLKFPKISRYWVWVTASISATSEIETNCHWFCYNFSDWAGLPISNHWSLSIPSENIRKILRVA